MTPDKTHDKMQSVPHGDKREHLDKAFFDRLATHPHLPAPGGQKWFFDDEIPTYAVRVRVTPAGQVKAAFAMVYTRDGAQKVHTFARLRDEKAAKLSSGAAREKTATPTEARKRAMLLRAKIVDGADPAGDKRAARGQRAAQKEAAKAAEAERRRKSAETLQALMDAYVAHKHETGRRDWKETQGIFRRNVTEPFPSLAAMPAEEVDDAALKQVMNRLTREGNYRAAEKVIAYLRAAYNEARKARKKGGMHAFDGLNITHNPAAEMGVERPKVSGEQAAREKKERVWALDEQQLAHYWRRINEVPAPHGALMRLHLLTGGQRVEQLARIKVEHHDQVAKTLTLYDGKGRRRVEHEHIVPLIPDAERALKDLRGDEGPHLFTLTNGREPSVPHTLAALVRGVAAEMVDAGEIERVFTPSIIRKTVETRLMVAGVSRETRAHLLSHGNRGGVQAEHYEAHDFLDEKRAALRKLRALCEPKGKAGNVTHIRRKA